MNSVLRTGAIARKELRQLRRDHLTFAMIIGVPIMQMLLFGYAINTDVRHLRAAVADLSGTQRARMLVEAAEASQVIDVVGKAAGAAELESLLLRGRVAVGILIPSDFERRVTEGSPTPAQLMVDGSDPLVLSAGLSLAALPMPGRSPPRLGAPSRNTFEVRAFYNPERRTAVQIVPALIGVILTLTMVLFTAVAIVRERERGTLELLITTPLRSSELMIGKIIPYVAIGLLQTTLALAVGVLIFDLPIRGTLLNTYLAALVFIGASLTMGLLISTLAQTQFQAMQMTMVSFLPQILLSGFMFPFDSMPQFARAVGELLPLTHFIRMIRGVLLRGAALGDVSQEFPPLVVFFAIALTVAIARFRKRLD